MVRFLKCLGAAFLKHGVKMAAGFVPLGPQIFDMVSDCWEEYSRVDEIGELRKDIEELAQSSAEQTDKAVKSVVKALAGKEPPEVQSMLEQYLEQGPPTTRQALRRPEDETGTTMPAGLKLEKPEDLIAFVPTRLPRFRPGEMPLAGTDLVLIELLGMGGFGEVWRARHQDRPRSHDVALKFCLAPHAAATLQRERNLLDQLSQQGKQPGIVQLLYAHTRSEPPCLEYEYVAGGNLAGLILEWQRRNLSRPANVAQVILRLASIVGSAHRLKPPIIHRDLKPANILVHREAAGKIRLKVADFGIGAVVSKQILAQQSHQPTSYHEVMTTAIKGTHTPLYASPQQIAGMPPDPRDDVHAIGVIWHQLLTGNLLKSRPSGDAWKKRLADKGMAEPLIELLIACCEDEPEDRPANANILAHELKAILDARASTSSTPAPTQGSPSKEEDEPEFKITRVEIPLTAELQVRPADSEDDEDWRKFLDTPAEFQVVPSEDYRLLVKELDVDKLAQDAPWKRLPNLYGISLTDCKEHVTDATLAHLAKSTQLRMVDLTNCSAITDVGVSKLRSIKTLVDLNLANCSEITDVGVGQLQVLTNLQELGLSGCSRITNAALMHLKSFAKLHTLELSFCDRINDSGLQLLTNLEHLKYLGLEACNAITDGGLEHLLELQQLTELDLDDCEKITDAGVATLSHISGLKSLRLANKEGAEGISDVALFQLKKLTKLESLLISHGGPFSDAGLTHLSSLSNITWLNLGSCGRMTDYGMSLLAGLPKLDFLCLYHCENLTDAALLHFEAHPTLNALYLQHCRQITQNGAISCLSDVPNLEYLHLSGCPWVPENYQDKLALQRRMVAAIPGLKSVFLDR